MRIVEKRSIRPIIQKPKIGKISSTCISYHLKTVHLVLSLGSLSLGSGGGGRGDSLDRGVLVVGSDLDDTLGLGFGDLDIVGEVLGGTLSAGGVGRLHNLDLDTEHTLSEENVSDGVVNKVTSGLTRVDHEALSELHRLGTSSTELAGNDNLTTLGARLHDESEDTVTSSSHSKTTEELVPEGLGLSSGGETSVLDLLGVELESVLGELEPLLDQSLELPNSSTLVTEDFLGVGGPDDDLGTGVGNTDLTAGVTLLSELSGEEVV